VSSAAQTAAKPRAVRRRPSALLVATAVATVGLVALPLVYLVVRVADGGAAAWTDALGRERTLELVLQTALLVVLVTVAAVAIGVPLAWLVVRSDLAGRRFWAVAAGLPLVVPSYVLALVVLAAFGPRGVLQEVLEPLGVDRVPDLRGLPGAVLVLTLATYPYVYLLTASALRALDPALEEASRGLGRSAFETFRRVTLPLLRPSIGAGALLVALYTLSDFGAVSLMRYDSLTRAVYLQYRSLFDRTPAAVLGLVLVLLTAVVLVLELRTRGRGALHRSSPGVARPQAPVALGRWRWAAYGLCGAVIGLGLVVPLVVLGYWLERAVSLGEPLAVGWEPIGNSLLVSVAAAAACIVAAVPVAFLAVRWQRPWTVALERLAYAGNALPGIVIALSLVFFAANYASPVYGTLGLLLAAYTIRFFPQGVAGAHAAIQRVDPHLEDAARGLGRRPLSVFASVTAPLAAPGFLAGAALVFLSTMKELPATLLLRPIGFETLATEIWTATTVGGYSRAALPALLLVALSVPFVYALSVRRRVSFDPPG
jgi:iron(III) transport system permease protein